MSGTYLYVKFFEVGVSRYIGTGGSQLDRVLDPHCVGIQLDTLVKAARAVGRNVEVSLSR